MQQSGTCVLVVGGIARGGELMQRLETAGFEVRSADSGRAALDAVARPSAGAPPACAPVDVVVLAAQLPDMAPEAVLADLRRGDPARPQAVLLAAPGADGPACIRAGAHDCLDQDANPDLVACKVRQAADRARLQDRVAEETALRCRMEDTLVAAQRLASVGTLAAGVAHEINNPLAVINDTVGWLETLLGTPECAEHPCTDRFAKGCAMLAKSVDRAKRITHQLLTFARSDEARIEPVDLAELAEDATQLLAKEARNADVALSVEPAEGLPTVHTDPGRLRQVLVNLVTNAVHASDKGGAVRVAIEGAEPGWVRLSVADQGPGIAPEAMERIFEPFFSTKPAGQGTGLGLFVSSGIVRALGGSITAENTPGAGARFQVLLPVQAPAPAAGADSKEAP